jgi:hypothetical protein
MEPNIQGVPTRNDNQGGSMSMLCLYQYRNSEILNLNGTGPFVSSNNCGIREAIQIIDISYQYQTDGLF